MIIQILAMTPLVAAVLVKYSQQRIKEIADLQFIWPFLVEEVEKIESVMPTVYRVGSKYAYIDKESAIKSMHTAYADVIQEVRTVKWFLNWLRRLFIVSGLSIDDQAYHKKIIELYEFANYMEANK